jgi:iron(III) transport system substrate-binding protein
MGALGILSTLALIAAACNATGGGAAATGGAISASASTSAATSPGGSGAAPPTVAPGGILVYTSVTQDTIDAVVGGFKSANPGVPVSVFRAPTGELAGRMAAEQREGRIRADVLWLTDPLSIQAYAAQNLLLRWMPSQASALKPAYAADSYWGTRLLNMVIVRQSSLTPAPASWHDLTSDAYKGAVAIPNPGFAGSAFGALGYFALDPGFGPDFYRALKANGAVQLNSPDDIVTGVAQGKYKVGMTLESSANAAIKKGSPVAIVWPQPGAIAIYSPIAVLAASTNPDGAKAFLEFVLSGPGQAAIAALGWQPIRSDVRGPVPGGPQVSPDWAAAFARRDQLLADYRAIFGDS